MLPAEYRREPGSVEMHVIVQMQRLRDKPFDGGVGHVRMRTDERNHPGNEHDERFVHAYDRHIVTFLEITCRGLLQQIGDAVGDPVEEPDVQRGVAEMEYKTGTEVSDEEYAGIRLVRNEFCGRLNTLYSSNEMHKLFADYSYMDS